MTNLFENISENNIIKIKQLLKANTITYQKGVNVISNIVYDDYIGIIEEGSIKIINNDYDGHKIVIEELSSGDIFGSINSYLSNDGVSCITKEETKITYIEYKQIVTNEIIKNDYYIIFTKNLIKLLNEQLTSKNKRIELLTKKTTRDKLLEYFRQQAQNKSTKIFTIPISFTELADYLCVDRSAMTREIGYLKEDGFIKTNGRKITLLY